MADLWLRRAAACVGLFLVGVLTSCSSEIGQLNPAQAGSSWVGAWQAVPENATANTVDNFAANERSYRMIIIPTVGGTEERIHLSNRYGTTALTIGAARLAVLGSTAPAIDSTRNAPLTFGGQTSVTIPAGQEVVSDAATVSYAFGERLAISFYLPGSFPALTLHTSEASINYTNPVGTGNTVADVAGTSFSESNSEWYLLSGLDVFGKYQGAISLFGSSSIDGHASSYGNTNSYPVANTSVVGQDNDRPSDWLARQLAAAGYNMGVLNAGTPGDPAGEDARTAAGSAIAGIDRMKTDVLTQPGVKAVLIYFGGIDLRTDCLAAPAIETSLTNMVSQANAAGLRVILATLPPSEYCLTATPLPSTASPYAGDINPGPENPGSTQRRALNAWIKTTGAALPGVVGIADFDAALADPNHPDFMIANLNSGDNFHPNGVGYGVQSSAIPLQAILPPQ